MLPTVDAADGKLFLSVIETARNCPPVSASLLNLYQRRFSSYLLGSQHSRPVRLGQHRARSRLRDHRLDDLDSIPLDPRFLGCTTVHTGLSFSFTLFRSWFTSCHSLYELASLDIVDYTGRTIRRQ